MAYTTIDKPSDYFNTKLYTGTGSSNAVTGVGFQPDWTWIKSRTATEAHRIIDSVRGAEEEIYSNLNDAEFNEAQGLKSFDSDGFTVGTTPGYNGNNKNIVSWNWKAGTSFTNDASSTSVGDIDSDGSVSATAGFSIAKFTTTGSSVQTVAHGLGSIPDMYIVKGRANGTHWFVYHKDIGNTHYLKLNATEAKTDNPMWGDTSPTSTVFSINPDNFGATTSIGYFFKSIKGYSKFGSYTGNGNADGTFVYTGFKPAWTLIKRTDSATGGSWILFDNKRGTNVINPVDVVMAASNNQSESDWGTTYDCDYLSNGFKWRMNGSGGYNNISGGTYIYMAFAENPFTTSTGVPATAR